MSKFILKVVKGCFLAFGVFIALIILISLIFGDKDAVMRQQIDAQIQTDGLATFIAQSSIDELNTYYGEANQFVEGFYMWNKDELYITWNIVTNDKPEFITFDITGGELTELEMANLIDLNLDQTQESKTEFNERIYYKMDGWNEASFASHYEGLDPYYDEERVYSVILN